MITPCCIFSYREDSFEAVLAARSAKLAGLFPVFVVEDAEKSISIEARRKMEQDDVIVITSDFPRPGNLRGIHCIYGMLQIYRRIMQKTGARAVVKMDSDTILTGSGSITTAVLRKDLMFGWSSPKYDFHGSCYVISRKMVDETLAFIKRWQGIPGFSNLNAPEDLAIFRMAVLLDSMAVAVSPYSKDGGFGGFWCWQDPVEYEPVYKARFESVSFGNRKTENGTPVSRVESYKAMESFLNHIERCQTHSSSDSRLAV